jgi:hypothetical protein
VHHVRHSKINVCQSTGKPPIPAPLVATLFFLIVLPVLS